MLKIITALLMMFLINSCNSVQTRAVCRELRKNEILPVEMCDMSFKFKRCRCRNFDVNAWKELSEPIDHPLEHCDGIAGFRLEEIALEMRPKIKAMYRLKENLCQ